MILAFHWCGPEADPVPLDYVGQIPGVAGVVGCRPDIPAGEAWPEEAILDLRRRANCAGLALEAVDGLEVHRDIMLGLPGRERLIENYALTVRRLAAEGVRAVAYGFAPDAGRAGPRAPQGDSAAFPGLDADGLRANLGFFLAALVPVCEACGVRLALRPDGPSRPSGGLPRIAGTAADLRRALDLVDSPANGLAFATIALAADPANDLPALAREFGARKRIPYAVIGNLRRIGKDGFLETAHPSADGELDLYEIMKALADTGFDGYLRPGRGRTIWGERPRSGDGLYDQALGIAYLNGLREALAKAGPEGGEAEARSENGFEWRERCAR
jgi:mannonate dehydratase